MADNLSGSLPHEDGCPWTIAGLDPSSGAGLYQDLKVFMACGLRGRGVPTALTVQNRLLVRGWEPVPPGLFVSMIETLQEEGGPDGVKIGLLPSDLVDPLRNFLEMVPKGTPLVLDPVFRFGTGREFWTPIRYREMARTLFPLLTLVTPNLPEAEELSGWSLERYPEDLSLMARRIHEEYGVPSVLIKGGHFEGAGPKADLLRTPEGEKLFFHPSRKIPGVHGGGCTLSSLIVGLAVRFCDRPLADLVDESLRLYQLMLERSTGDTRLVLDPWTMHAG